MQFYRFNTTLLEELEAKTEENKELEELFAVRNIGEQVVNRCLIKWKNMIHEDTTWEDGAFLKSQFCSFNLEDKVGHAEGGSDREHGSMEYELVEARLKPRVFYTVEDCGYENMCNQLLRISFFFNRSMAMKIF